MTVPAPQLPVPQVPPVNPAEGQTQYVDTNAAAAAPAATQQPASVSVGEGIMCPNCSTYNEFSVNGNKHMPEGYTRRTKACKQCKYRIYTAECYIGPAPEKRSRGKA